MLRIVYGLIIGVLCMHSVYAAAQKAATAQKPATAKPAAAKANTSTKPATAKAAPATPAAPPVLTLKEYLSSMPSNQKAEFGSDFLLLTDENINAVDQSNNMTLLMKALQAKNIILTNLLLQDPLVNVALVDKNRSTALHYAVKIHDAAILKTLLSKKPALNDKDKDGCTPLILATRVKNTAAALALINDGATLNDQDNDGYTALMYAAEHGIAQVVEALLAKKADKTLKNNDQHTAHDLALLWNFRGAWVGKLQLA